MPSIKKTKVAPVVEAPYQIKREVLEELIPGPMTAEGVESIFRQIKKALLERALNAELTHHLGYAKGEAPAEAGNHRNGSSPKTVLTDDGPLTLDIPRDRMGSFEPQIIGKHERRFTGFDDKIVSMYARGMSVREIQGHLLEMYAVEVSPQFISDVTDAVMAEVTEWQNRPLEPMYPVVFFDCLRVKIRDEGTVRNKAVYLALGVLPDGSRDVLGLWIEQTEGAKFWLKVFNELRNRGVQDILIAVVDGLKGFPESIETAFPLATVQTCIVHLIRNSLDYVSWTNRKAVAAALRPVYTAPIEAAAREALAAFENGEWGQKHPTIAAAWHRNWERVIPFFAFPPDIRRVIYTTNAIESLHMRLRKIIKTRGHFPSDEAAIKLLWLALRNITADWGKAAKEWKAAMNQFALLYAERFTEARG
ncbi:IS256 family transposase [Sulfuricystis multivorans]|uniref:IS256 family transposase n=1 Tax=Sulfuricystis multivorans TaxID=2211108 RepID=UPI000F81A8F8|nr:IS256 family transposase [Sulfuricystis multivorans]